jgi:hypothetical protein
MDKIWSGYIFWVDKSARDFLDTSVILQVRDGSYLLDGLLDKWLFRISASLESLGHNSSSY